MKTRLYYDTGAEFYFRELAQHVRVPGIGSTVYLPTGKYRVKAVIDSPSAYNNKTNPPSKRSGWDKLVEIFTGENPAEIQRVKLLRYAQDLDAASSIIKPGDQAFDDVVFLTLESVGAHPENFVELVGKAHRLAASASRRRGSRRRSADVVPDGPIVLKEVPGK